jgi:phosphoenolpyruvate---glycerone phosphotransferase subunit DhaL
MSDSFTKAAGGKIVENLVPVIQTNKQYLSDLDGLIGDGDHGVNMNKGFTIFQQEVAGKSGDLPQNLKALSKVLMSSIGGSMGPLYGMLFRGMAAGCNDHEVVDKTVMLAILQAGLNEVKKVSEARVGDKTLMDVLIPAVASYEQSIETSGFIESLETMRRAAMVGRDSTMDLIAKVGRSSRLGERSRGVLDAGSVSCCLILESIADSVIDLLA